jgi:hypothetical protein
LVPTTDVRNNLTLLIAGKGLNFKVWDPILKLITSIKSGRNPAYKFSLDGATRPNVRINVFRPEIPYWPAQTAHSSNDIRRCAVQGCAVSAVLLNATLCSSRQRSNIKIDAGAWLRTPQNPYSKCKPLTLSSEMSVLGFEAFMACLPGIYNARFTAARLNRKE